MNLPNFFIAGAPKAGTDLLFYQLEQHPQIYMSPLKEPNYFADEIRPQNFHASLHPLIEKNFASMRAYLDACTPTKRFGGIVSNLDDYRRLFANAGSQPAIGEGSVCYLWSRSAAERIADAIPHARIILVLMDPAERAFHQYLKSLSDGTVSHDFSEHLELAFKDRSGPELEIRHFNPFLAFGEYSEQVNRYLQTFPRSQLFISLYEDTQTDYDRWFDEVLAFLHVDTKFRPSEVEVPSMPRFPVRHPTQHILPEDRGRLVDHYRADILRLQELINRDLSAWLR
jgi:hypothetical protein